MKVCSHIKLVFLPWLLWLAACTPEPGPIAYGEDQGAYCKMTISDARYAAELVTKKGRVYKFDSIECLAGFYHEHPELHGEVHSLWVTDFQSPSTLIRVDDAFFLHSSNLRSPMGMNLTAFGDQISRDSVLHAFAGELLAWPEVLGLVQRTWGEDGGPLRRPGPAAHDTVSMKPHEHGR